MSDPDGKKENDNQNFPEEKRERVQGCFPIYPHNLDIPKAKFPHPDQQVNAILGPSPATKVEFKQTGDERA